MELRAEECYSALTKMPVVDPDSMTPEESVIAIGDYISETTVREMNADGTPKPISPATINAHRTMWLTRQRTAYEKWEVLDNKAFGIIYRLCNATAQGLISAEKSSSRAMAKLQEAYK